MSNQSEKTPCSIALLAHVDAGKTTLSEVLLYVSGTKRTLGRVDHGDAAQLQPGACLRLYNRVHISFHIMISLLIDRSGIERFLLLHTIIQPLCANSQSKIFHPHILLSQPGKVKKPVMTP